MPQMTPAEIEQFLEAPRHAVVGTNSAGGAPQLSPVWYLYEAGRLYFSLALSTVKYRNLQRDSRLSVCVDGCHPDARTVMIYGTVAMIGWGEPLEREMWWRIIQRYYETEEAVRRYADTIRDTPMVLAVVTPEKIISQDYN